MTTKDIAIVGSGVMGLTAAHQLALRGARVTLYDRNRDVGRGCSWWAGGMLALWCEMESAEPLIGELGLESLSYWREHFPHVINKGSLVVAPPRDTPDLKRFAARTSHFEVIDGKRVAALEPDLAGRFETGLFFEKEAHLDPRKALGFLSERLQKDLGVRFVMEGDVRPEALDADHVLDCRGFEARDVLPDLRGVKGEMLIVRTSEISFARPIRLLHPRIPVYIVPRDDHHFMVGATMIESSDQSRISARSMVELLNAAYALHPSFGEAEIIETGTDVRPAFPDNLPRIRRDGKILRLNGLYRHGYLGAPALTRRAAEIVMEGKTFPEVER
ncbi:MAG: FAD-dependent oxidoreductase [Alphaproteobacteria bacterium]|jgi:glycine oxidase|nr:FAD-dependent oxidoreductase [Alphaproteobacteria bacterium]